MATENLRITITADNRDALAKFQQTIKGLDGITAESEKAGGATKKLGRDFTGVSRVIQDLPYGFNGIANNLTQLVPAAGAAGLAFSALVAGLTFAQTGLANWTRGLKLASDATNFMNKVSEGYVENVAKERSALDSLYLTATNLNAPMKVRNEAVAQMQKQYGAYLNNMDAESIKAGLAADNYMRIVEALDKKAMAQAAEEVKVDQYKQLIQLQQERNLLDEKYNKLNPNETTEKNNKGYREINTTAAGFNEKLKEKNELSAEDILKTQTMTKEYSALDKKIANVWSSIGMLNKTIQQNQTDPFEIPKPDKENVTAFEQYLYNLQVYIDESAAGAASFNRLKQSISDIGLVSTAMQPIQQQGIKNIQLSTQGNTALNNVLNSQAVTMDLLKQKQNEAFATGAAEFFTSKINELFTQLQNGVSIGDAIGNMFKRLAADIAIAAAKAMIFQAIMAAFSGGATVGAKAGQAVGASMMGTAAPAAAKGGGGFLKLLGKLLGFSEGGTVSGPKSGYPVMLHGTEHIVRPDQMRSIIASAAQMGGGNSRVIVEGRIRGNDIFLSQQRTGQFRSLTT
jgi:hypothetical protein